MKNPVKTITSTLAIVAIALTLSSCTSTDSSKPSASASSSSAAAAAPAVPLLKFTNLTGVRTEIVLDEGFAANLKVAKAKPATVGRATVATNKEITTYSLPITGGQENYYNPADSKKLKSGVFAGTVQHTGEGLGFNVGGTKLSFKNPLFNTSTKGTVNADVDVNGSTKSSNVAVFNLDPSTITPLVQDSKGNAVISGATLTLTKAAADLLNSQLKTNIFAADQNVGTAKFTLTLPKNISS